MGDSITRAFDATRPLDNPKLSWSTGDDIFSRVESHLVRIREMHGIKVLGYNVARSGGKAVEMPGQAKKLARHKPNYVTMLIGANDLCDWSANADADIELLEKNVRKAIDVLIESNPNVLIAISPVPDMHNLWEIGSGNRCQKKWDLLKICPRLLSSKSTTAARDIFKSQWADVNQTYERIAADFPKNVRYAAEGANVKFEPKHISTLDCFHPSITGQNLLSEIVWDAVAPDMYLIEQTAVTGSQN
jgi:lysophospholipase L1-like esterase